MRRIVFIFPILVFVVVGAFFAYGLTRDPSNIPSQLIDRPLPEFDLPAIQGLQDGLSTEDIKGEVALVNVFASWCVSCHIEHPVLMELTKANAVPIYGLNWKDAPGDGKAWLDRYGNPYKAVGDDQKGRVAIDLGVTGAPETFVVDRQGRVRFKVVGPITEQYWTDTLQPLIEELRRS
ncbi:DsbE family thiol:disulfide interchange protein [Hyphococcus luteus]|uniref:DsbE family thiol:disulfide interchange protein n=1 Tax=Hyphococcus luteus TaxID=2058213 RepID=A0A2S7K2Z6_9PROT|nr:DsbE family thiol:disulfide interchange protein [Marinicaulis flavus]PQA86861.1 DsbE family thiol:disulfide interchange protein [Marinicaulis flavus]